VWAIIEKKIDSWAKNVPYRRLNALIGTGFVDIGNLVREDNGWESKEVDPVMTISVSLSNFQETVPLFHSLFSLFEPTFFNTTCLHLRIYDGTEALMPSVDNFRGFVNLEKLIVENDSLLEILFPLLQHANPVLLPAIKSICFYHVTFQDGSDSTLRVANFLQWRREQGYPVQRIEITGDRIDKKYVLSLIQDTVVEMDSDDSDIENY